MRLFGQGAVGVVFADNEQAVIVERDGGEFVGVGGVGVAGGGGRSDKGGAVARGVVGVR